MSDRPTCLRLFFRPTAWQMDVEDFHDTAVFACMYGFNSDESSTIPITRLSQLMLTDW